MSTTITHATNETLGTTDAGIAAVSHDRFARAAAVVAVIGTGLAAGFFYTYQVSVTRGLARVDDQTYVATFQAINATIRNALFGLVFFGTIPSLLVALVAHLRIGSRARWLVLAGLGGYLGAIAVTMFGNVELNNQLATADARSTTAASLARAEFEHSWNQLNLVRTLLAFAAFVALVAATQVSRPTNSGP
jgi:uncharacterized membrane protein